MLRPGLGTTTTVKGLINGDVYTFTVAAENGLVVGPASVMTAPVTVGTPAAAAAVKVARTGKGTLKVSFSAARTNGAPITAYTARCRSSNGGRTRSKTGRAGPLTVTGLSAGKSYTCTVEATNSRGSGVASRARRPSRPDRPGGWAAPRPGRPGAGFARR